MRIYRDMVAIREFETMLNLIKPRMLITALSILIRDRLTSHTVRNFRRRYGLSS